MKMDFSNQGIWDPLAGGSLDEGVYPVKITKVDPAYNGGKSTEFEMEITSGAAVGRKTSIYLGNEPGKNNSNVRKWKTLLVAVATAKGKTEEEALKAFSGEMSFDPVQTFTNQPAFILVTPNDTTFKDPTTGAERKSGPDREFMTKGQYESYQKAHAAGGAQNGATPGATQTPPKSAPQGDVLKGLFDS